MKKCYILVDIKWVRGYSPFSEEEMYMENIVHIYSSYESAVADAYALMNALEGQSIEEEEKSDTTLRLSFESKDYYGEIWQHVLSIEERSIHDTPVKDFDV